MRASTLSLCLLLVTPAIAADQTETIPLRFVRAAEVERMLLPGEAANDRSGLGGPKALAPQGLVAWTANDTTNALTVTGSAEAIAQLKNLVRILDVPARQIHLEVRVLRLDAAGLKRFDELAPAVKGAEKGLPRAAALEGKQAQQVTAGAKALAAAELPTSNQRPFHMRWSEPAEEPARHLTLTPRLNGDGSLTIMLPLDTADRPGEKSLFTMRRIQVGQTIMALPRPDGPALMVTFKALGQ